VPGPRAFLQYVPVNAFSIVANPQAKVKRIVANFGFDAAGVRMTESVSQHLVADLVNSPRGPQVLDRPPALIDGLLGAVDRVIESLNARFGTPRKNIPGRLHLDQRSVKALQQRIVEIACKSGTLSGRS